VTSTSNTVVNGVSNPSFSINASTGLATFNNAVVRGTVYATAGQIGGITIASNAVRAGQTAYNTGTGFYLGSNGTFSLGNSAGNRLTWDGTNLNVVGGGTFSGAIAGATYTTTSGKFSVSSGGVMTATDGNFSGAITGSTISTNSGLFSVGSNGVLTAVEANIERRVVISTGFFTPAGLANGTYPTTDGQGNATTGYFPAGSVIQNNEVIFIDTEIDDHYLVGTGYTQPYGVMVYGTGNTTYSGGTGLFNFSGHATAVVNRRYSSGGVSTLKDKRIYIVVHKVFVTCESIFTYIYWPQFTWKLYKT